MGKKETTALALASAVATGGASLGVLGATAGAVGTAGTIASGVMASSKANKDKIKAIRKEQEQKKLERKNLLKSQIARQRAAFGARGVSSNSGSALALQQGITSTTAQKIGQDSALANSKIKDIKKSFDPYESVSPIFSYIKTDNKKEKDNG